jgi:hypothetical protein
MVRGPQHREDSPDIVALGNNRERHQEGIKEHQPTAEIMGETKF